MVLKLYGYYEPLGATAIVAMTLVEKHIPFDFVFVDLDADEHKTEQYLAKQPFGQVPTLVCIVLSPVPELSEINMIVASGRRRLPAV
jgi:glutathione S-transferase